MEALSDALRFEVRAFGIDVIVVEPGPIKTRFGDTAMASLGTSGVAAPRPTRRSTRWSRTASATPTRGRWARFAAGPEAVARVIERAITAPRPRTRYAVTAAAHMMLALRRWLPDRAFDAFLRTQFKVPAAP